MHKNFKALIAILVTCLFFTTSNVEALQIKNAKDNETILIKASNKEFNRVMVPGDQISSVIGNENAYEVQEFKGQNNIGVLYIKPSASFQNRPFSVFITTLQGHSFTLFISGLSIPSETIQINPLTASKLAAGKWETDSSYAKMLLKLIKKMANRERPQGFAVINIDKAKVYKLPNQLNMQLLTVYRGNNIDGEIWKISNPNSEMVDIKPQYFYQDHTRAATLVSESLPAHSSTILYRVVSDE